MRNRAFVLGAELIAFLCLAGAAAVLLVLLQMRTSPQTLLRNLMLEYRTHNLACVPPTQLVPGSYHADPPQTVGDFVVVTYAAECESPGPTRQAFGGYVADDQQGGGCGSATSLWTVTPRASGTLTISVIGISQCPGTARHGGLSFITGYISGAGAVSAQVLFGAGDPASAPVHAGRFVVLAPNDNGICIVRALDAAGAVQAELKLGQAGAKRLRGACP